jgi:hypothetical protein
MIPGTSALRFEVSTGSDSDRVDPLAEGYPVAIAPGTDSIAIGSLH